ncbi:MAG: peptidoglycan bridge formation glycyltransferase FemA/FemB family protein [Patescibacteria group bacterium]|jgi:lipid II:glycine glycyltransferase (peptidoglycan interpeptide bridge formation enzyme)
MNNSIFQTESWAEFKLSTGYSDKYRLDDVLVLDKKLPLLRSMLYSPMVSASQESRLLNQEFISSIRSLATKTNAIFYRLELGVPIDEIRDTRYEIRKLGFRKSFEEMQPEHTLVLDINNTEEDILAQMKPKGRYNIKIASKNQIEIMVSDKPGQELDHFYELYETMARRQNISRRNKAYFEALLEIMSRLGYIRVYNAVATVENKKHVLAAAIICFYGERATYLFGGSSNEHRNLMAPYLLHWQIIKDAKQIGCSEYDLFGVAPNDDEKHPWAGVTRFKNQFGGKRVDLVGSWDLVFKPTEYEIFKFVEKIRR